MQSRILDLWRFYVSWTLISRKAQEYNNVRDRLDLVHERSHLVGANLGTHTGAQLTDVFFFELGKQYRVLRF